MNVRRASNRLITCLRQEDLARRCRFNVNKSATYALGRLRNGLITNGLCRLDRLTISDNGFIVAGAHYLRETDDLNGLAGLYVCLLGYFYYRGFSG